MIPSESRAARRLFYLPETSAALSAGVSALTLRVSAEGLAASAFASRPGIHTSQGHASAIPALAVMIAVLPFNLLGDAWRDWLDPRTRSQMTALDQSTAP